MCKQPVDPSDACGGADFCSTDGCFKQSASVILTFNSNDPAYANVQQISLDYDHFMVEFTITGVQPQAGRRSSLDFAGIKSCAASNGYDVSLFSVTQVGNQYKAVLTLNKDPLDDCPANAIILRRRNLIGLSTNFFSAQLFNIAVNTYPGETVTMTCNTASYGLGPTTSCALPCNPMVTQFTTQAISGSAYTGAKLQFGPTTTDPVTGAKMVEVQFKSFSSTALTLDFDFALNIAMAQVMEIPTSISLDPAVNADIPSQNGSNWSCHFSGDGFVLQPSEIKAIGKITVNPPINMSLGGTATLGFDVANGRIDLNDGANCQKLFMPNAQRTLTFAGNAPCSSDDFSLRVIGDPLFSSCNDLMVQVALAPNNSSVPSVELWAMTVELEFTTSPGIGLSHFSDLNANNSWGCPSSSCTTITGNRAKYTFKRGSNASNHTINFGTDGAIVGLHFNIAGNGGGCVQDVVVRRFELGIVANGVRQDVCVPNFDPSTDITGLPFCLPEIQGTIVTENNENVGGATVNIAGPTSNCTGQDVTTTAGPYAVCVCQAPGNYVVTPERNDNPLNGVSTYDLLLISKHILGVEPLNSPFKIIAADANKNGSVAASDIVELRKLILGLYNYLPNNTSWRFIDKNYIFPVPANPFMPAFPESVTLSNINFSQMPAGTADFWAIKVGDVSGNAVPRPSIPGNALLEQPVSVAFPRAESGEYVSVPVTYQGGEPLAAMQMGLKFDPTHLEFVGTSAGDAIGFTKDNFGLAKLNEGEIRVSWLSVAADDNTQVEPGTTLFYLTFKVLQTLNRADALRTDNAVLENMAWAADGAAFALVSTAEPAAAPRAQASTFNAIAQPNPASDILRIQTVAAREGKVRLSIFDAFGKRLLFQEHTMLAGDSQFEFPQIATWPSGVYVWEARSGKERVRGRFVKQ